MFSFVTFDIVIFIEVPKFECDLSDFFESCPLGDSEGVAESFISVYGYGFFITFVLDFFIKFIFFMSSLDIANDD